MIVPFTFGRVNVRVVLAPIDAVENFALREASELLIMNEVASDRDLFVNVSVPSRVLNVPLVGSVIEVVAVEISVVANAPDVVKFPPRVIVFPELFTPVPPY
jgi:hypothetical protein